MRKKWKRRHEEVTQNLFDKHLHKVAASSLGGLMLLTTPGLSMGSGSYSQTIDQSKIIAATNKNIQLVKDLNGKIPDDLRNLNPEEEKDTEKMLSDTFGIRIKAEIDGKRLNRTYGVIGGEQHLYRYPGDSLQAHARDAQDWAMYGPSGIAPGLGAWGYFVPSRKAFTEKDELRERYYLVVQTFLSPGFAERTAEYRDFYKFRKMLVVNPKTGQAVVAVIGDAGPAEWTGKHLGGSPEVMHELGLAGGIKKGPVLYFFIDDPEDKVPLGSIKLAEEVVST